MTPVERVARAIYEAVPRNRPWAKLPAPQKEHCAILARAAIQAMREPTFEMVEAPASLEVDPGTADDVWQAMISAALQEPTP